MINSEKDLEDYICDNQEEFIKAIKYTFYFLKDKEIKFVGRQVNIGKDNRADLIYCYEDKVINTKDNEIIVDDLDYIIVELKFRKLELEDLGQISRYMSVLEAKINDDLKIENNIKYCGNILGIFVSFGLSNSFQEVCIAEILERIGFITIDTQIEFFNQSYSKKEEYIKNLELDSRIENLYGGKDESRNN